MTVLKGRPVAEADYADVQKQLQDIFYRLLFAPLVELLAPHNAQVKAAARELKNSKSAVRELRNASVAPVVNGIRSGKIQYSDGVFSGDFNAAISSALRSYGAQFNKTTGNFTLAPQDMPVEVLAAVNEYADVARQLHEELMKKIDEIGRNLTYTVGSADYRVDPERMVKKTESQFNKHYGDALGHEELSDRAKRELAKDYSDNMNLWIVNFAVDMIKDLRGIVAENAQKGYRFDNLVDKIQIRYDVVPTKAAFLARQETSLYVSKHKEQRFTDVGVVEYIWRTSGDSEVRTSPHGGHKALNGKRFTFKDKAQAQYFSCGTPSNPGEDFQCRCVADPVLPGVLEEVGAGA